MKISTLIIDDEALARETIRTYLIDEDRVEVIGECKNGSEALVMINDLEPDMIFLDIEMPNMSGISMLEDQRLSHMPMIIFSTAYDEFALKAFELNAIDYLLKPFDQRRFQLTVDKAIKTHLAQHNEMYNAGVLQFQADYAAIVQNSFPDKLVFKDNKRIFHLPIHEIDFVKGSGDYVEIHWDGKFKLLYRSISDIEQRLEPKTFRRVHKSFIINIQHISEIRTHTNGEFFFHLKCGEVVKSGRTFKDQISDLVQTNI